MSWFGGELCGEESALSVDVKPTAKYYGAEGLKFQFYKIHGDFIVDWGDGTIDYFTNETGTETVNHTYSTDGIYRVKVYPKTGDRSIDLVILNTLTIISFSPFIGANYIEKVVRLNSFGDIKYLDVYDTGNIGLCSLLKTYQAAHEYIPGYLKGSSDFRSASDGLRAAFYDSSVFNDDIGSWDVSNVSNMTSMFYNSSSFNNGGSSSIGNWDVSSVTNFSDMFWGASSFNQPIGNWNFDNVATVTVTQMFRDASSFNQDIGSWDASKMRGPVRFLAGASSFNNGGSTAINSWNTANFLSGNCTEFMQGCSSFNQPVDNWNTSNITNIRNLFDGCTVFNQDIGSWDVSSASDFGAMFRNAYAFNNGGSTSINSWDVSSATSLFAMFQNARAFDQPIGSWDTSNVTRMDSMFSTNTVFNQDIGGWTLDNCTNLNGFIRNRSTLFDNGGSTAISEWNTSNVTTMANMVQEANVNFDVTYWDTSSVTNMYRFARGNTVWTGIGMENWDFSSLVNGSEAFSAASSFNVDLGNVPLNTLSTPNFSNMLSSSGLSDENYSRTLIGWANFVFDNNGPYNVTLGASLIQYQDNTNTYTGYGSGEFTDAPAARAYLTGVTAGWTITDAGQA